MVSTLRGDWGGCRELVGGSSQRDCDRHDYRNDWSRGRDWENRDPSRASPGGRFRSRSGFDRLVWSTDRDCCGHWGGHFLLSHGSLRRIKHGSDWSERLEDHLRESCDLDRQFDRSDGSRGYGGTSSSPVGGGSRSRYCDYVPYRFWNRSCSRSTRSISGSWAQRSQHYLKD